MGAKLCSYRGEHTVALRILTNRHLGECQLSIVESSYTCQHLPQSLAKFSTDFLIIAHIAIIRLFQTRLQRLTALALQLVKKIGIRHLHKSSQLLALLNLSLNSSR